MQDFSFVGKGLVGLGLLLMLAGSLILLFGKIPFLGKLPGDIHIERPGFSFYFPLATCLLLSALFSLVAWVLSKLK